MELELGLLRPLSADAFSSNTLSDSARCSKSSGFSQTECALSRFNTKVSSLRRLKAHSGYGGSLESNLLRGPWTRQSSIIKAAAADTFVDVRKEFKDDVDFIKGGGTELKFVQMHAFKDLGQLRIADQ